jgi:hypothetical protein
MTDAYKKALDVAKQEVDQLTREQTEVTGRLGEIEKRLIELRQSIAALSKLAGEPFDEAAALGVTEAIRQAVESAGRPVSADDVRTLLESRGFNTARYANLLAAIITILKRLRQNGEITEMVVNNRLAYEWNKKSRAPIPPSMRRAIGRN